MSALNSGLPNQPDKAFPPPTPANLTTIVVAGPGSFVPSGTTKWLRVTLLGGGGAGNSTSTGTPCSSGIAAKPVTYWVKKTKSTYAYVIGIGGVGVAAGPGGGGGSTTFDTLSAPGAPGGVYNPMTGASHGEHSPYGAGGFPSYGGSPGSNATGFGAGGGGSSNSQSGGNGSGGLIIIEEY